MGEVTMATSGLLPKINSLLNNPLFSDVEFVFMDGNKKCEKIYCHKLILSLQSRAFAHLFFEKETSPCIINVEVSKKQLFYLLFKFLYTGDVQFHTFDEAQDLCELASDYVVNELVKRCHSYMMEGRLTIENIFTRYEHALERHNEMLLKESRNFVSSNVQIVLKSDGFINASHRVVEDIVKLDNLSLSSELEIIKAVLNWGSERIRRNEKYNKKSLKESIDPFWKHLRFLSLTSSEFEYLVKHYNIFSSFESMLLIQKIVIPNCDIKLPEGFCCITSKRSTTILSRRSSSEYQQHDLVRSSSPTSPKSDNKLAFEVRKYSVKDTRVSPLIKQKFKSSPNISDVKHSTQSFSQNYIRDYVFDLQESEKSFRLSFHNDIKCWLGIRMKKGNLSLHGFELKVKKKSEKKEEIEVSVHLQGFSQQSFEKSYKLELHSNVLSVKFPNQMNLLQGNKGKLEICIENLSLDRYSQIQIDKVYEFYSGLNFEGEMCIGSNRKTDNDSSSLFLINKLIYMPF